MPPTWAHSPLSGAGAARAGGRWNRPGQAALYASIELFTAVSEYQQVIDVRPGTFLAFDVFAPAILDLRQPAMRQVVGISTADLLSEWKVIAYDEGGDPPTWRACDAAVTAGADGSLVPSARTPGGTNLVLWRWNDGQVRVDVHDPNREMPPPPV